MKKIGLMLLAALLLAGCGQVEAAETVADVWEEPVAVAAPREVRLELPGEAVACAMESDTGRLYFGEGIGGKPGAGRDFTASMGVIIY